MITKPILVCLTFLFFSCEKPAPTCFTNPLSDKPICSIGDLHDQSLKFEQYDGFHFSLDTLYFKDGMANQDLDIGDIVDQEQIDRFSDYDLTGLTFTGDGLMSDNVLDSLYGIVRVKGSKKKWRELSLLYSKREKKMIGELEYFPYKKRFIIRITG